MDINIISNDVELQKKFIETKYFNEVLINNEFKCDQKIKYILVSDKLISFSNFIEQLTTDVIENNVVFYMLSGCPDSTLKNYTSILKAKGVICIPPKLTNAQIIESVCKEIGIATNTNKNIAVFLGADSKVGVTMTTQAIAENIATNSETTVCLLFLNGQPSMDYIKEDKYSTGLDNLKVKLLSNVLSANEFIDNCIKIGNLYVLPGAELIYDARHFHPNHIENLINLATKVFGIVLIDAGCKLGIGMSIGALNSTSNKFLITTQQDIPLRNFNRTKDQILNELDISTKDFMLVINKYISNSQLYTPAELADTIYKIPLAGILPSLDYAWQAERNKNTLLNYNSSEYNRQISELANLVCLKIGINYKYIEKKKYGFFKKLK
jgi:Flp pilus assembly CpaE family ATPase